MPVVAGGHDIVSGASWVRLGIGVGGALGESVSRQPATSIREVWRGEFGDYLHLCVGFYFGHPKESVELMICDEH